MIYRWTFINESASGYIISGTIWYYHIGWRHRMQLFNLANLAAQPKASEDLTVQYNSRKFSAIESHSRLTSWPPSRVRLTAQSRSRPCLCVPPSCHRDIGSGYHYRCHYRRFVSCNQALIPHWNFTLAGVIVGCRASQLNSAPPSLRW